MWLVIIGAIAVALKYFEVSFFAQLSWWWVLTPLFLAFVYFEVIEPMFGFDKKKAHNEMDKARERRVKALYDRKPKKK